MAETTLRTATEEITNNFSALQGSSAQPLLEKTRIFLIGRHDYALHGLASMLETHDKRYLITCVEPDEACMAKLEASPPDALLIHNDSLPSSFDTLLADVQQRFPAVRILVFGKDMDDDRLYDLVRTGVHGYINERMNGDHFLRALEHILQGKRWVERHILERFITDRQDFDTQLKAELNTRIDSLCERLTRREMEILAEVIQGLAIKQIAEQVHLSHQGVKMHLAKLFKKFNVTNRNQLILATFDYISPGESLSGRLRDGLNLKLDAKPARTRLS